MARNVRVEKLPEFLFFRLSVVGRSSDGQRTVVGRPGDARRTVVGGACVVSGAEKKAFDRGGPVWPPRSNAADDRLGGGSGGALPPQPKFGGSGGQRPQAKNEKF